MEDQNLQEKEGKGEATQEPTDLQVTTAQLERIPEIKASRKFKRHHVSDNSYLDKEISKIEEGNQLAIVSSILSQEEWRKVEKKKWIKV